MIGTSLTHYRITAKLGEGGMGEVYRATDTKLGREVAIKVLPASFSRDPQSHARFEREAKALATLNHPHIAAIYGFDADLGTQFLVLELVEGETLSERLRRGRLPVEESLRVARQIAEAVEAAHAKGIIHRDLKPGNIKFTSDSRVKVLDFGLAKLGHPGSAGVLAGSSLRDGRAGEDAGAPGADASTRRADSTEPGKVMGTPAYMSPEQARGLEVDKRTDVWAFGCCLFECLSGNKPFGGETVTDLMASVLRSEPDWSALPAEAPREIVTLLRRCLEKEPRRRLSSLGDIAILLDESTQASRRPAEAVTTVSTAKRSATSQRNWAWPVAAALGAALVVAGFFIWHGQVRGQGTTQIRSVAVLPFENQSPDQGSATSYVSESMPDQIRTQLRELEGVSVKRGYKTLRQSERTPREEARALGVDALVTGSYLLRDGRLQLKVFLVDGATGSDQLLGDSLEGAESEIIELQKRAAVTIAEKLRGRLTDQERNQIKARSDVKSDAYVAYRKGLDRWNSRRLEEAKQKFKEAIQIDARMEIARVGALKVGMVETVFGGSKNAPGDAFEEFNKQLAAIPQERRVAPVYGEAKLWSAMLYDRNWKEFKKLLLELKPVLETAKSTTGDANLLHPVAWYNTLIEGRFFDATGALKTALRDDPNSVVFEIDQAHICYNLGHYKEGLLIVNALSRDSRVGLEDFSHILLKNGQLSEGKSMAESILLSRPNVFAQCNLASLHIAARETAAAQRILGALEQEKKAGTHIPYGWMALAYGDLGDFNSAFRWLQDGVSNGRGDWSILTMRSVPYLEVFADQHQYWALIDQIDFPPLPVEHPFYEVEQRMRYGKGGGVISSTATNAPLKTLAVLPLEPLGNWVDTDGLSDGLTIALNESLQKVKGLKVPGWISSMTFKGATNLLSAGRGLQVDHLLVGRVARAGDQLRFSLSLDRSEGGPSLWNTNFVRKQSDIFDLQSEIAQQVAGALKVTLGLQERQDLNRRGTDSPEAYELYLKGRAAWNKRTLPDFERAIGFFNQALEKDTNFALAYSGLAVVHVVLPSYSQVDPSAHSEKIKRYAHKALELDPRLAEPHAALGYDRAQGSWDWEGAEREFQTAITLDPGSAEAHRWYGDVLADCLRNEEALLHHESSLQIDPGSRANRTSYAETLTRMKQRRDEAIQVLTRWSESDPHWYRYQEYLFVAHVRNLQLDEAETVLNRMSELPAADENVTLGKGRVLARSYLLALKGRKAEARTLLATAASPGELDAMKALTLHAVGDASTAMTVLEGLIERRGLLQDFFFFLPEWSGLYGDPRFRAILRKVNLDRYVPIPSSTNAP